MDVFIASKDIKKVGYRKLDSDSTPTVGGNTRMNEFLKFRQIFKSALEDIADLLVKEEDMVLKQTEIYCLEKELKKELQKMIDDKKDNPVPENKGYVKFIMDQSVRIHLRKKEDKIIYFLDKVLLVIQYCISQEKSMYVSFIDLNKEMEGV
jgi:hypothetical protein